MRFLYFILISNIFISCSSVPKEYLTTNDSCYYKDPIFKITKEEVILEIKKDTILINSNDFKNQFWNLSNGYTTNKQTNKQIGISKLIGFYKTGKIESVYFEYNNGNTKIYKEILYNQQEKIEKIINHEKGYKICWNEAIEIVKIIAKRDIKKFEIKQFYLSRNNLNEFPNVKPIWTVGLMNGNEKFSTEIDKKGKIRYVIDGVTGKLIRTFRVTIE